MTAKAKILAAVLVLAPSFALAQGSPIPPALTQFTDQNGAPLAAGTVLFCVPNTSCAALKQTWSNYQLTTPNTNPVVLDASGRAAIFGSGTYEEQVKDLNGNLIFDSLTTAVNGSLLLSVPAQSILANPNGTAAAPQAVPILAPLAITPSGLTISQSMVADNTNQLVDPTYNNTQRYTTGTNPLTYTLSPSSSFASGFSFQIVANIAVTVNANAVDTIQDWGTSLTLLQGQTLTLSTNGQGLWLAAVVQQVGNVPLPAGMVLQMRGQACPAGSVPEDGSSYTQKRYPLLYAAIGQAWGAGSGSATFNVPNAAGQFNRGWEANQTSARAFASAQQDAFQDHTFNYVESNINNVTFNAAGSVPFTVNGGQLGTAGNGAPATVGEPIASNGGTPRVANETRPVNITELSCISTGQLF